MKYIIGIIIILIVIGFVMKARASFIDGQSVNLRKVYQLPIEAKWVDGRSVLEFKIMPAAVSSPTSSSGSYQ